MCCDDYTPEQIQVWISSVDSTQRWLDKMEKQYFLIALHVEQIVGFASLDGMYYLDFMYVHKDFQGRGIATRLCAEIEGEAIKRGATELRTDASINARPFFKKMGFETVMENWKIIQGVEITNYAMRKELKKHAGL
jgi:putative acetyltransferase